MPGMMATSEDHSRAIPAGMGTAAAGDVADREEEPVRAHRRLGRGALASPLSGPSPSSRLSRRAHDDRPLISSFPGQADTNQFPCHHMAPLADATLQGTQLP